MQLQSGICGTLFLNQNVENLRNLSNSHLQQNGRTGQSAMKDYVVSRDKYEVQTASFRKMTLRFFGILNTHKVATPLGAETRTPNKNKTNTTETPQSKPKLLAQVQQCQQKSRQHEKCLFKVAVI